MLAPTPNAMLPQEAPPKFHDVTIRKKTSTEKACVGPVPPEEFGIASRARSIKECGYCFHAVPRMAGDLIAEGFDADEVNDLPTYRPWVRAEEAARDSVNETAMGPPGDYSQSTRMVQIFEHYIEMDYDGEGLAVYKVTTGEDNQPLHRKGFDPVERMDAGFPFASITPVPMTHRFWGRSVADLVMDVQRIKTVLVRGLLDNLYFRNNFRTEVPETHASRNTIDDLLNSRPGGIVRTKQPGGLAPIPVEDVTQAIYPALQYFDATREWRTGVSRQGQGIDPNALQNQVATIANQMEAMSDKKVKLIARIFADTGIRDLFQLLHATIRKYGSKPQTVRLRNTWTTVDPREWKSREDMTVKVALGTGNKAQQLAGQQLIIQAQIQGIQAGLVSKENLWNSAQELCRIVGHPDAARFFVDPMAPPDQGNPAAAPLPPPQDPKQAEIAAKAQAEQAKMQADAAHQKMKIEQEAAIEKIQLQHKMAIEQMQFQHDRELALLKAQVEIQTANHNAALKERELQHNSQIKEREHQMDTDSHHMEMQQKHVEFMSKAIEAMNKPKKLVREGGKIVGVETQH